MCICCDFSLDTELVQLAIDGNKPSPATQPSPLSTPGSRSPRSKSPRSKSPNKPAEPNILKPPEPQKQERKRSPKASPRIDSKSPVPKIEVTFQEEVTTHHFDHDPEPVYDNAFPVAPKRRHKKRASCHGNNGL